MKKLIVVLCALLMLCPVLAFAKNDKKVKKEKKDKVKIENKINIEKQEVNEMEAIKEVYDFLKKCKTYYIATVENDKPQVRPFGTVDIFENKLYIQTGKVKNVSKQMAVNPNIAICAFDGNTWLRISAEVCDDDRIEAKQHMLDNYPELQNMYKADDGNTQVLYLKNATATFSSFTSAPKTVKF